MLGFVNSAQPGPGCIAYSSRQFLPVLVYLLPTRVLGEGGRVGWAGVRTNSTRVMRVSEPLRYGLSGRETLRGTCDLWRRERGVPSLTEIC